MVMSAVSDWFRTRGFGLTLEPAEDGSYWASLTRLTDGQAVAPDYGSGSTPEEAAVSAKARFEVVQ
jgi:hypothetical protein